MWNEKMKDDLISAMKDPFSVKVNESQRSSASRDREMSRTTLLSRVRTQISEMEDLGLSWDTPEQWDESFRLLGGGSSRRTSDAILTRMSWGEFLNLTQSFRDRR